jgi:tripartite-type tricarboxylate transporter receptor subunit TctC
MQSQSSNPVREDAVVKNVKFFLVLVASLLSISNRFVPAAAGQEFYRGNHLTFIVASGEGGGYAVHSRLFIKYLGRHIPGHPDIVIQFMPGAGGVKGANYMYNVAPRDGATLGMPLSTIVLDEILRPKAVKYKAERFHWLGALTRLNFVMMLWHTAPAQSIDEAKTTPLIMGATARGAPNYQEPKIANVLLGTKFRIVTGYRDTAAIHLALERGEINGQDSTWDSWYAMKGDWIKERKIIPILQTGSDPAPGLANVPRFIDLVKSPEDKAIVGLLNASWDIGRSVYAPPGIPADRAKILETAVAKTVNDAGYIADAVARNIPHQPVSASRIRKVVESAAHTDSSVAAKLRAILLRQ